MPPDINVFTIVAYISCITIWFLFLERKIKIKRKWQSAALQEYPFISIIVPARNEEKNLPLLLQSLTTLDYPGYEVIVVDDGSIDQTVAIATGFGVQVVSAPPQPGNWNGKSWACYCGAQLAKGEFLLFTDADTIHRKQSLRQAIAHVVQEKIDLLTAVLYHLNRYWWEKLSGPFHCLIHAGASPWRTVSEKYPYALGQYILVRRTLYWKVDGHRAVAQQISDDASMARLVLQHGGKVAVHSSPLCMVQMFSSFKEFVGGWNRIMRLGMNALSFEIVLLTVLPLLSLNVINLFPFDVLQWIPVAGLLLYFLVTQRNYGRFSTWGVVLFPFPVLLFVIVSLFSLAAQILNLPVMWRGRAYRVSPESPSHASA